MNYCDYLFLGFSTNYTLLTHTHTDRNPSGFPLSKEQKNKKNKNKILPHSENRAFILPPLLKPTSQLPFRYSWIPHHAFPHNIDTISVNIPWRCFEFPGFVGLGVFSSKECLLACLNERVLLAVANAPEIIVIETPEHNATEVLFANIFRLRWDRENG